MLHRMVLAARTHVNTGTGALEGEFGSLLACCMQTSVNDTLTGGLVAEAGFLLTVLEGESAQLCDLHVRAEADARIGTLQVLEFVPILRREYDTWAVARTAPGSTNPALIEALDDRRAGPFAVSQHVRRVLMQGVLAQTPPLCVAA